MHSQLHVHAHTTKTMQCACVDENVFRQAHYFLLAIFHEKMYPFGWQAGGGTNQNVAVISTEHSNIDDGSEIDINYNMVVI